ncbi:MAG: hemagluttinin family protein [Parcubacteria group bacterium GW2011_GWB1_57_6]|nr:MAG: hemagluttinin family protein [Parcubacteria group bacterium GW2011_GWB1_57_6]
MVIDQNDRMFPYSGLGATRGPVSQPPGPVRLPQMEPTKGLLPKRTVKSRRKGYEQRKPSGLAIPPDYPMTLGPSFLLGHGGSQVGRGSSFSSPRVRTAPALGMPDDEQFFYGGRLVPPDAYDFAEGGEVEYGGDEGLSDEEKRQREAAAIANAGDVPVPAPAPQPPAPTGPIFGPPVPTYQENVQAVAQQMTPAQLQGAANELAQSGYYDTVVPVIRDIQSAIAGRNEAGAYPVPAQPTRQQTMERLAAQLGGGTGVGNVVRGAISNVATETVLPALQRTIVGGSPVGGQLAGLPGATTYEQGTKAELPYAVAAREQAGAIGEKVGEPVGLGGVTRFIALGDTGTGFWSPTASTLALSTGGVERLRIDADGNVGIGTSSPDALLSLQQVTNGTTFLSAYRVTDIAPSGDFISFKQNDGTTLFRVDNSGNLLAGGIINSGSQTITSTSQPQFRIQYDPSNEITFAAGVTGTTTVGLNGTAPGLAFTPQSNLVNQFNFTNASSDSVLSIDTVNKRVGVGTTSPWAQLSVNPNGITGPAFVVGSSTATNFIVTNAGKVGIGTAAPSNQLSVAGSIDLGTMGNFLTGYGRSISWSTAGTSHNDSASLMALSGNILKIRGSGAITLNEDNSGNVGIGTTSPWAQLSVNPNGITGPSFVIGSSTATNFIVTNKGNVGIGTTNTYTNGTGNLTVNNFLQVGNSIQGLGGGSQGDLFLGGGTGNSQVYINAGAIGSIVSGGISLGETNNYWSNAFIASTITFGSAGAGDTGLSRISAGKIGVGTGTAGSSAGTLIANTVGIGTTSPGAKLHIEGGTSGSSFASMYLINNTAYSAGSAVRISLAPDSAYGSNPATYAPYIESYAQNDASKAGLAFATYNGAGFPEERLRITAAGNVGIGTTSPSTRLHIVDSNPVGAANTVANQDVLTVDSNTYAYINLRSPSSGTDIAGGILFSDDARARGGVIYNHRESNAVSDRLDFLTSAGTRMSINSSGNVGIGTTTPGALLDVYKTGSNDPLVQFGSWGLTDNHAVTLMNGAGELDLFVSGASDTFMLGTTQGDVGMFFTSGDDFHLGNKNASPYVTVKDGGNVGIGILSPTALLDVSAAAASTDIVRIRAGGAGISLGTNASGFGLIGNTAFGSVITIDTSGNVGIGDTTPSYKLEVNGDFNATAVYSNGVLLSPGTGSNWSVSGSDIYRSAGNVGIGTTSPQSLLHLSSSSIDGVHFRLESADTGGNVWEIISTGSNNDGGAGNLRFYNGITGVGPVFTSTGNVGIGTTSPQSPLHIENGSPLIVTFDNDAAMSASRPAWAAGATGALYEIGSITSYSGTIVNDVTARLVIDASGLVGIGTSTPGAKLEIYDDTFGGATPLAVYGNSDNITITDISTNRQNQGSLLYISTPNELSNSNSIGMFGVGDASDTGQKGNLFHITQTGNVGIGTTTPGRALHVLSSGDQAIFEGTGNAGVDIRAQGAEAGNLAYLDLATNSTGVATPDYNVRIAGYEDNSLRIYSSDTNERIRMTSDGNVGIGTTSPWSIATNYGTLAIGGTDGGGLRFGKNNGGTARFYADDGGMFLQVASTTLPMVFATGGNERIRIDKDGNVGIGTTSPAAQGSGASPRILEVYGGSDVGMLNLSSSATSDGSSAGAVAFITSASPSADKRLGLVVGANDGSSAASTNGRLTFWTNNAGTIAERMRIDKSGNVGIGTTDTSTYKVNVNGSLNATEIRVNGVVLNPGTGSNWTVSGSDIYRLAGNVGIGTTSPASLLHVNGPGTFTPFGGSDARQVVITTPGGTDGGIVLSANSSDATTRVDISRVSGDLTFALGSGTAERMRITSSGNVGIGTTTPSNKLTIYTGNIANANEGISLTRGAVGAPQDNVFGMRLKSDASGNYRGAFTITSNIGNPETEALTIGTGGNVGIGTTSPETLLDVNKTVAGGEVQLRVKNPSNSASAAASVIVEVGGSSATGDARYVTSDGTTYWAFGQDISASNAFKISQNAALGTNDFLTILTSGNVGIGTTSPQALLHLNSTGNTVLTIESVGDNNPAIRFRSNDIQKAVLGYDKDIDAFKISHSESGTSFTDNQLIIKSGNVGIGTTTPTSYVGATRVLDVYNAVDTSISIGKAGKNYEFFLGSDNALTFRDSTAGVVRMLISSSGLVGIGTTSPATLLEVGGSTNNITFDGYKNCTGYTSNSNGLLACTASDQRLKQDISPLAGASGLAAIGALNPVSFYWKPAAERGTNEQFGLIAQDVRNVFPNLVTTTNPTPLAPDGTLTIDYQGLIAPMVLAIQQLDARTKFIVSAASSTALTVGNAGDIGVGTSIAGISAKFSVSGNVFATSYETANIPATSFTLGSTNSTSSPQATFTAQIPSAVLTALGSVDLYKLATYNLSGISALALALEEQEARITSLESRVAALENGTITSTSGTTSLSTTSLTDALNTLGVFIKSGFAQFGTLVADRFVAAADSAGTASAGTVTILAGNTVAQVNNAYVTPATKVFITFTAPVTGSWYINDKKAGSFKVVLANAQTTDASFDYFLVQTEGQMATTTTTISGPSVELSGGTTATSQTTTTSTTLTAGTTDTSTTTATSTVGTTGPTATTTPSSSDTIAPVVTLNGDAAMQITVGDTFTDPGATASDPPTDSSEQATDLTAHITVSGAVNTATAGLYTLTYSATDAAGNTGSASRVVTVAAPATSTSSPQASSPSDGTTTTTIDTTTSTTDTTTATTDTTSSTDTTSAPPVDTTSP